MKLYVHTLFTNAVRSARYETFFTEHAHMARSFPTRASARGHIVALRKGITVRFPNREQSFCGSFHVEEIGPQKFVLFCEIPDPPVLELKEIKPKYLPKRIPFDYETEEEL